MGKTITQTELYKICEMVSGLDLHKYGVPYDGALGMIFPENVDEMLVAVERFPELHVVSYNEAFNGVNHFYEGAAFYHLVTGCADPNISFSGKSSMADATEEDVEEFEIALEKIRAEPMENDPVLIAASNWMRARVLKKNRV